MLRYTISDSDLSAVRFALSPLNELGLSLRALSYPARFPAHLSWVRTVAESTAPTDLAILRALVDERLWVPDFLTPVPVSPLTRFDDEIATLATLADDLVERDLDAVHTSRPALLRGRPAAVRARIVEAVGAYWQTSFQPSWSRMRGVLDADIVFRGRAISRTGLAGMFAGLSPAVAFDGRYVTLCHRDPRVRIVETGGAGLTLIPSLFTLRMSSPVHDSAPPSVVYPARGAATLLEPALPTAGTALVDLLGRTRATLLEALHEPTSSTELARRLGITTSAVNQHLRVMHDAGLLTRARHGRSVLYLTSSVGAALAPLSAQ
ncbi:ArsR/SmtB family transcription factor [Sanguibacter antarcticus]|uniref:Helix-turn-helix protein n=1 Tax=Sanguibacter antarcticus TaxID=372484 RepID=A0A2A9E514_9MICO|nr:DUF5937 family protein [Sanguibacter antarcticus]PFG33445.1 helix-turn-helix protein [Sanguibacter antarcticus]